MNTNSFIFGTIVGAGLGSALTYFIVKGKCEKKFGVEREEIREYYKNKYSAKTLKIKPDPSVVAASTNGEDDIHDYEETTKRYKSESIDPAELEVPSEDDAPDEYYEDYFDPGDVAADSYDAQNRRQEPKIIFEDDFGNAPGYDAKEISYYVPDKTFVDDFDNIIDDELYLFGRGVQQWKDDSEEVEDIIVRNFNIQTDFKITKMFCSFEPEE